jgi:hypothetical protein
VHAVERADDPLELGAFAPEFLRTLRFRPHRRVGEFTQDLGQALALAIVVKGTP